MKRTIEIKGDYAYTNGRRVGYLTNTIRRSFFKYTDGFYEVDIEESKRGRYRVFKNDNPDGPLMVHIESPWRWSYYGLICSQKFAAVFFPLKHKKRYNITIKKVELK